MSNTPPPPRVGHFGVGGLTPKALEEKFAFFCLWVSGWQGGWGPTARTLAPVGVGHFWVPGFSKNLGGRVSQSTRQGCIRREGDLRGGPRSR